MVGDTELAISRMHFVFVLFLFSHNGLLTVFLRNADVYDIYDFFLTNGALILILLDGTFLLLCQIV
jgi:hypothetical protein